ncbi:hypothetical protein [Paracidovorax valerianellae]|uniref:hypothetical protein n=1 Tax=Paracidovorax valerianellae TaxID=187868 RepID=UPI001113C61B|nr:hypothetical protein [Paracidovorax valerianellae]MDA8447461.1 hypothetical protein [Paracidovorax valerianellae]
MKYIAIALFVSPFIPLLAVLLFYFYDPSLMGAAYSNSVGGYTPIVQMFLIFLMVARTPFYLTNALQLRNIFAKWISMLFGCFFLLLNPFAEFLKKISLLIYPYGNSNYLNGLSYFDYELYLKLFWRDVVGMTLILLFPLIFAIFSFFIVGKLENIVTSIRLKKRVNK